MDITLGSTWCIGNVLINIPKLNEVLDSRPALCSETGSLKWALVLCDSKNENSASVSCFIFESIIAIHKLNNVNTSTLSDKNETELKMCGWLISIMWISKIFVWANFFVFLFYICLRNANPMKSNEKQLFSSFSSLRKVFCPHSKKALIVHDYGYEHVWIYTSSYLHN